MRTDRYYLPIVRSFHALCAENALKILNRKQLLLSNSAHRQIFGHIVNQTLIFLNNVSLDATLIWQFLIPCCQHQHGSVRIPEVLPGIRSGNPSLSVGP